MFSRALYSTLGALYLCGAARSLVRNGLLDGVEPGSAPPEFDELVE